jgi:restriction endonuclease-like protein
MTHYARAVIFKHLPADLILKCYQDAGGDEIRSGKFANPESSACLVANAFGFFLDKPEILSLPAPKVIPGGARTVSLEKQMRFPWTGGDHPWLDVAITTEDTLIGIESKRYEPFRDKKIATFSDAYLRPIWGSAMAPYEKMRDELTSGQRRFDFLNAVQLVKHAFGLRTQANKQGKTAKLVYLYAEPKAYPLAINKHREEVRAFAKDIRRAKSDASFSA